MSPSPPYHRALHSHQRRLRATIATQNATLDAAGFCLWPLLLKADDRFAGWCGVMVNLSDIAAMGGRPIAVVDALWAPDAARMSPILRGLSDAARVYGVPVVGGHTGGGGAPNLAVAVLGRATHLLTSTDARPGDVLLAAIDLRGDWHPPHPFWDAASRGAPAASPQVPRDG